MTLIDWPRRLTLDPLDPHDLCRARREEAVAEAVALDAENRSLLEQIERLSVWVVDKGGKPRDIRAGKT